MKTKRILSVLLSASLITAMTGSFSTFTAEEMIIDEVGGTDFVTESYTDESTYSVVEEEIIYEDADIYGSEPVYDDFSGEVIEEYVPDESYIVDSFENTEPIIEDTVIPDEEVLPFSEGYIFVTKGTTAYADILENPVSFGEFLEDSIVFAELYQTGETIESDWFQIVFEMKNEDGTLQDVFAYIQRQDFMELTDEELTSLYDSFELTDKAELGIYKDFYYVPQASFQIYVPVEEEISSSLTEELVTDEAFLAVQPLAIDAEPEDFTCLPGKPATFTVVATGDGLTYQWQTKLSETASWGNTGLSGCKTATLSFNAPSVYDGRQYRCIIKDSAGNSVTSRAATLTVTTLSITSEPQDITVQPGKQASFSVQAVGNGLTYQWQTKLSETASWGNTGLNGNKTDTLSFNAPSVYDGRQYRCIIKDSAGNQVISAEATLHVNALKITVEPEDVTVQPGKPASFTVEAEGTDLKYQWQTKLSETASWGNTGLGGSKTATLSFNAPSAYNGRQYRCIITDGAGNQVISREATLTVSALKIVTEPEDQAVQAGKAVSFTVEASGSGLTYQWQTKLSETASWGNTGLNGNKTDTLSFNAPSAYDGRQYRCIVKDSAGNQVISREATLSVSSLKITTEPEDQTVQAGKPATFTVVASGNGLTYQWQTKLSETADWGNTGLGGSKTATLSFNAPSAYNNRQYRCIITDASGKQVISKAATLFVSALKITAEPEDQTVQAGKPVSITVQATGSDLTYQWQTKLSETAEWGNTGLNGNKTDTLSFNAPSAYNGRQYRCIVTDGFGKQVISKAMTLTVVKRHVVDNVVYEVIDDVMCVVGYEGTETSYTVQETVDGKTVKKIAEGAFENNTALESIDLPDSIEVIGKRAFANCSNLKSMT